MNKLNHLPSIAQRSSDYLQSLQHKENGGFSFATGQPSTLMGTAYAVLGLEACGKISDLGREDQHRTIRFLMSGMKADGSFKDPLFKKEDVLSHEHDTDYFTEETTTFCQQALDALHAPPPAERKKISELSKDDLLETFKKFSWKNPWLDANRVMLTLSQIVHEADRHHKPELLKLVDAALDWLDTHQSRETGLWKKSRGVSMDHVMAATTHFSYYYLYRHRPMKFSAKIIDSCLKLQRFDGLFSGDSIGHSCFDYDAIDLMMKASLWTAHKREAVQKAVGRTVKPLTLLANPDGGFCHAKYRKIKLFGFYIPELLKTRASGQYHNCWKFLSCPVMASNGFSTWLRLITFFHAQSESQRIFRSRRLPFLGYHSGKI